MKISKSPKNMAEIILKVNYIKHKHYAEIHRILIIYEGRKKQTCYCKLLKSPAQVVLKYVKAEQV